MWFTYASGTMVSSVAVVSRVVNSSPMCASQSVLSACCAAVKPASMHAFSFILTSLSPPGFVHSLTGLARLPKNHPTCHSKARCFPISCSKTTQPVIPRSAASQQVAAKLRNLSFRGRGLPEESAFFLHLAPNHFPRRAPCHFRHKKRALVKIKSPAPSNLNQFVEYLRDHLLLDQC